MSHILGLFLFRLLGVFLQIIVSFVFYSFFYNVFTRAYLKGRSWSVTMPEMLKEDRATSIITFLSAAIVLFIAIVINILYKPFVGFYLVSFFLLFTCSDLIFPPRGRKISGNCYVMPYHKDHFIVTLNERKIYITGEYLRGNPDQIIYKEQSPKWLPPHENEPVSEEDYEYVLNAVFKFLTKIKKEGVIK